MDKPKLVVTKTCALKGEHQLTGSDTKVKMLVPPNSFASNMQNENIKLAMQGHLKIFVYPSN